MSMATNISALPLSILAGRCAAESEKFFARREHLPDFCLELFRRAIVGRDGRAWEMVYRQYQPLVSGWVQRHSAFPAAGEEVDYFVNRAFERMWSSITAEKFARFSTLRSLLSYLQMCVNSSIVDNLRALRRLELVEPMSEDHGDMVDPATADEEAIARLDRAALWQLIERQLKDERELIVADGAFVRGLKPQEIYDDHRGHFGSVVEVYHVRRNILARLERDPELRRFLEG